MSKKIDAILAKARDLAKISNSWGDFSNAIFDPEEGLLAGVYPTQEARERFMKTKEYKEICELRRQVQNRTGLVAGAASTKSGKFVVRLPRSLHAALEIEAKNEGVSLNQLVTTKLAVGMGQLLGLQAKA